MSASQSPDGFDEDLSDFDDLDNPPPSAKRAKKGKSTAKGKSKGSNSAPVQEEGNETASARKLQNRVAQREFRQRKLQYVKDLEARVEFLSSSKDDQLEALKAMLRGMLDENKQLRAMLQTVTSFVGDGIGGLTSKFGLKNHTDVDSFMEFVARGDRETLITLYDNWKERKAAGATDDMPMEEPERDGMAQLTSKSKAGATERNAPGWSSQRSSRASSPVNAAGANAAEAGGASRKRGRNEKSNSATAPTRSTSDNSGVKPGTAPKQDSNAVNGSKPKTTTSQLGDEVTTSNTSGYTPPTIVSSSSGKPPSGSAFTAAPTQQLAPPPAYQNYMELMAAASAPSAANTATNFNHSFYTQQPTNNANNGWQDFLNFGNNSGYNNGRGPFDNNNSNNAGNTSASSAFFFDTAEPMSMPTSSFTNEFVNQYIHTGLTPLINPSYQSSMFPWSSNSAEPQQGAPTPTSSTSSMNQLPSPANQNSNANHTSVQSQNNSFVPQLSLGQMSIQSQLAQQQQHSHQQQQQQAQQLHQPPPVPPQIYNPLASPRSSLPSIPPGFSPDEIINSNPLLAAIHIISFHLRNKAANPNYVLPPALEPTPIQASTPHDFRLDGILHREWRTRLLSKMDYNINELLPDLMQASTVHPGDNLLDPTNWEVSESFLRKYKHTITPDVLTDSNKWRRSRGEPEVQL